MPSMKLSPLLLFLILLIVLVISVIFGKMLNMEGFVSFGKSLETMDTILIPEYSTTKQVHKVYDNLYYDYGNGNLIEVDSPAFDGNTDLTGSTISALYVTPRDGKTTTIYTTQIQGNTITAVNTDKSMMPTLPVSYSSWIYPSNSPGTDHYTNFYIPWADSTFIHVINNDAKMHVGTYMFAASNVMEQNIYKTNASIDLTSYIVDTDASNNTMVNDIYYDPSKQLYQMSKYVKYDIANSNLIIQQGDGNTKQLAIFDRYSNPIVVNAPNMVTGTSNNVPTTTYNSWVVMDACGQNMVVYAHIARKTLVAIINYNTNTQKYNLANVRRFTESGVDNGSLAITAPNVVEQPATLPPTTPPPTTPPPTTPPPTTPPPDKKNNEDNLLFDTKSDSAMSEYFKWYWFWKTNKNPNTEVSEDYILKTQIVPPVCPSCPSCNYPENKKSGVCTDCGGQGGSGTRTNIPGAVVSLGNTAGGMFNKTVDATGKLIGGVEDIVEDTAKGTVGLAKETVSGAVGLLRDTGSGIKSILTQNSSGGYQQGGYQQGGYQQGGYQQGGYPQGGYQQGGYPQGGYPQAQKPGMDNYSYYGALPAKSGNYMPLTADFSAFGR